LTLPVLSPSLDFDEAAQLVLGYLRDHVPLALWSVTRVQEGRQTFLYLNEDNGYQVPRGGSHAWEDSFCIHMASGAAPAVAPDAQAVPQYAAAPVNELHTIGSYAGAVVTEPDGQLFGAICGIDPKVRSDDPAFLAVTPLLQLLGQLLSMVLAANRARESATRSIARARVEAETDLLTGLFNRRAWERVLAEETVRFARFGDPTAVAMIDLDLLKKVNDEQGHAAGDGYIRAAAVALLQAVRSGDIVARLGGDEFGLLMFSCTQEVAEQRITLLYEHLEAAGVAGSVGWAPISVLHGFPAALADADQAMYDAKRDRREQRKAAAAAR
jgi:diguanylate cyclase (GGDEF)-like protein